MTLGRVAFGWPALTDGTFFRLFLTDEEQFANLQLGRNLLLRSCRETLWEGEIERRRVQVCGVFNRRLH